MKRIRGFLINAFIWVCNLLFFNKKKIVFQSFLGRNYSGNPRAIFESLIKQGNSANSTIVWAFKNPELYRNLLPKKVKLCRLYSISYFFHLATAKIWIDNFEKPSFLDKNKRQIFILSYHGDRGFKKILNDSIPGMINGEYFCDYIVTGSVFAENMMKGAFNYRGPFLKIGSPRNDVLFTNDFEKIKTIKDRLKLGLDYKVLMYAPTYRNSQRSSEIDVHILDPLKNLVHLLNTTTKEQWVLLIRSHPGINGFKSFGSDSFIINVSSYDDMAELLFITDFLISDYSSCAGDFILTDRPIVLYQYDFESYLYNDRQFYFDIKTTDFLIAYNEKELLEKSIIALAEDSSVRNKKIQKFYGAYERGTASQSVVDKINEILNTQ